jgi:hypothetical protein
MRTLATSLASIAFLFMGLWVPDPDAQQGGGGRPGGPGADGRGRGPAGPPQITQIAGDLY